MIFPLLHFPGFQKYAGQLLHELEIMSLIIQVDFSFQNLLIQCICLKTICCFGDLTDINPIGI